MLLCMPTIKSNAFYTVLIFVGVNFKLWLLLWKAEITKCILGTETFLNIALYFQHYS